MLVPRFLNHDPLACLESVVLRLAFLVVAAFDDPILDLDAHLISHRRLAYGLEGLLVLSRYEAILAHYLGQFDGFGAFELLQLVITLQSENALVSCSYGGSKRLERHFSSAMAIYKDT